MPLKNLEILVCDNMLINGAGFMKTKGKIQEQEEWCSCGCCGHSEHHQHSRKSLLFDYLWDIFKIVISLCLLVIGCIVSNHIIKLIIFILSAFSVGYKLLLLCAKNIAKGIIFNENTLMLVASIVAFILGEYFEGAFVVLLYSVGELLEGFATANSKRKIAGLAGLKSETAHLIGKGGIADVEPDCVGVGSLIEVRRGERVPIDGVVFGCSAQFDVKAITGESEYINTKSGDSVFSGAINVGNPMVLRTTKLYKDSTVEKIIRCVQQSAKQKSQSQRFITSFAKIYTPIIGVFALLIAVLVPLIDGFNFSRWIYKALSLLVISCPCALVVSVPLAYFVGIGALAKSGVLVKGGNYIDAVAKAQIAVFDKTGTLTKGEFEVVDIVALGKYDKDEIIEYAISLEKHSNHPLAKAIVKAKNNCKYKAIDIVEDAGKGVMGIVNGLSVVVGSADYLEINGLEVNSVFSGVEIFVGIDGQLCGVLLLQDQIKENATDSLSLLKKYGIFRTIILSGDKEESVKHIAEFVGVDEYYAKLMPEEKYEKLKTLQSSSVGTTIYVGDGINDSPSIACADVGVAMGALGSEIAIDSADVVVMDDDLMRLPKLIKFSKKIRKTVFENIVFSLMVKLLIMALGFFVNLPMWLAITADVGCMLLAVLNSLSNYKL